MQPALFHESIQDALREVIRAAGGAKIVGSKLWPSLPVDQAASKISDCLNPDRRQHLSIQDALREVIRAAGGAKIVGSKLWPSLPVDQAASKISDCLNPDRRQHFNETEVLHLLRLGREVECHAGLHYIASICGYSQPEPVTPADEVQALQQQFILATKELKAMSQRLEAITARANLQAVR